MLRLLGREPGTAPPAVRLNHPDPADLKRFVRGELARDEARDVVRHLLTGCPACLQVTRRMWSLGDQPLLNVEDRA